jgi:hypothetical protein
MLLVRSLILTIAMSLLSVSLAVVTLLAVSLAVSLLSVPLAVVTLLTMTLAMSLLSISIGSVPSAHSAEAHVSVGLAAVSLLSVPLAVVTLLTMTLAMSLLAVAKVISGNRSVLSESHPGLLILHSAQLSIALTDDQILGVVFLHICSRGRLGHYQQQCNHKGEKHALDSHA